MASAPRSSQAKYLWRNVISSLTASKRFASPSLKSMSYSTQVLQLVMLPGETFFETEVMVSYKGGNPCSEASVAIISGFILFETRLNVGYSVTVNIEMLLIPTIQ